MTDVVRRTGWAAVFAGALFFLGQGGELVLGDDSRPVLALLVAFLAISIICFVIAFLGLRTLLAGSRLGRIGAMVGVVGSSFLVAFAIQLALAAVRTGEVPENFILFALGFLLVFAAQLLLSRPLGSLVGRARWLSPLAAFALLIALVVNEKYIWHDLALFAFEACWVALGLSLLRGSAVARSASTAGT